MRFLRARRVGAVFVVAQVVGTTAAALADPEDIDTSYGDAGTKVADFYGFDDQVSDMTMQADGKVLIAGDTGNGLIQTSPC